MSTYTLFSDAARDTALNAIGGEMMGTQDTELLKQIFVAAGNASGGGGVAEVSQSDSTEITLASTDLNKVIVVESAAPVLINAPRSLETGFQCSIIQGRDGIAAVRPGTGAVVNGLDMNNATSAKYARVELLKTDDGDFLLSGDTAVAPILDGYATPIGAWSTRQKLRSEYTGPIVQIRKVDPTLGNTDYDVYAQADGTVLANGTGGIVDGTPAGTVTSFIYLTIYDQSGNGNHLAVVDATKAMRAASSTGVVETLNGDPCGLVVSDNQGGYKCNLGTAITSTTISSYVVNSWGVSPANNNISVLGLTNGSGAVWNTTNGAIVVGRKDKTLSSWFYRNALSSSVPIDAMFWENERTVSVTRLDGATANHNMGACVGTLAATVAFNANRILLHGYNDSSLANYGGVNMRFVEGALWNSDIGAFKLSSIQRSASICPNRLSKLSGKKLVWVGTSMPVTVTDNSNRNPYPMQVGTQLGAWVVNVGSGSSRITYSAASNKTLTATVAEQIANGFSSSTNESFEVRALGGSGDVDYFVMDHCINDYAQTVGAITSTTKTEFCGALNYFRTQTMAAHPNAKFIVLTPMTSAAFDGLYVADITAKANALVSWAAQYDNCFVINPMTGLGLTIANKATYFPDGVHCNMAGAELMANFIVDAIEELNIP